MGRIHLLVWGAAENDVWAVGRSKIDTPDDLSLERQRVEYRRHCRKIRTWNGTSWSAGPTTGNQLTGFFGFAGRPTWAYGDGDAILRYRP